MARSSESHGTHDQSAEEHNRISRERDKERKHVSTMMRERDSARKALDEANARVIAARQRIEELTRALEPFALAGLRALNDDGSPEDFLEEKHFAEAIELTDRARLEARRALLASKQGGAE